MRKLKYVGTDNWSRPVYKDQSGKFWKDVNLGYGEPYIHSSSPSKDFEGEPDYPIEGEYEIVGKYQTKTKTQNKNKNKNNMEKRSEI